jgi:monoamine oxidase
MSERFDLIVIGGGLAGLKAAADASARGLRVVLLEGRERLGGRVHSLDSPSLPVPIELGAEFIHGRVAETFDLARAAGLLIERLPDAHLWRRGEGLVPKNDFWDEVSRFFETIPTEGKDVSFAALMRRRRSTPEMRRLALSFVEGFHAADLERVSAHAVASNGEGSDDQFRILSGQSALARFLHDAAVLHRCDLRLQRVVRAVEWKKGSVTVNAAARSGEERYTARAAIIALPLGVLQAPAGAEAAVEFDPPLATKSAALAHLAMGQVTRIVFRFRERFWDEADFLSKRIEGEAPAELGFLHDADAAVPTWWSAAPAQLPLLTAWAGGPKGERLLDLSETERADTALRSLAKSLAMRPARIRALVEEWWTHDWRSDPFSRGSYSYALVGGANAARTLARPIDDTLFFAGEATSSEQSGTVAGALESGERAARELLAMESGHGKRRKSRR